MNAHTPTPAIHQPRPAAKHTPGPWRAEKDETAEVFDIKCNYGTVAMTDDLSPKTNEANARLIASAPALADVARTASTLAERIRQELIRAGFSGPSISDLRDLADAAAAAISQAEGGAQ